MPDQDLTSAAEERNNSAPKLRVLGTERSSSTADTASVGVEDANPSAANRRTPPTGDIQGSTGATEEANQAEPQGFASTPVEETSLAAPSVRELPSSHARAQPSSHMTHTLFSHQLLRQRRVSRRAGAGTARVGGPTQNPQPGETLTTSVCPPGLSCQVRAARCAALDI